MTASTSETILYYIGVGYASGCTSEMGSVSGSGSYEEGATAVIKAVANEGYRFVKWDDDNTSAERSITVAAEHNYLALFEAIPSDTATITLTVNEALGGNVKIDDGEAGETVSKTVAKGTQVTITATPNTNYRFNRWTGNIEQNPYTLTVTEDLDLEAEFESTL